MNRPAIAIAGTRGGSFISLFPQNNEEMNLNHKFSKFSVIHYLQKIDSNSERKANFGKFFERKYTGRIRRVPIARRVRLLNVALTMNPLVIFSSLVPDGQKA